MTSHSEITTYYLVESEPVENTLRYVAMVRGKGEKIVPQLVATYPDLRSVNCTNWAGNIGSLLDIFVESMQSHGWQAWKDKSKKLTTLVIAGPIDNQFLAGVYMDTHDAKARVASLSERVETRTCFTRAKASLAVRRNIITPFDNKEWI